jgi:3-hydroxyacyl-[acyl-carrier-protein] dehydratase
MRFLFVDRILELRPGQSIKAEKYISPEEDYFKDHFPGFPVVPGVLLTEMMAQAAGKCLDAEGSPRGKAMLAQIRSAGFREWVRPGQTALIRAEIKVNRDQYAAATCSVEVSGTKIGNADLLFAFLPLENFAFDFRDEVLENFLSSQQKKKT